MFKFAARITDPTQHMMTPLSPGPGSFNVVIGNLFAWRALPAAAVAALQAQKQTADTTVQTAQAATIAAAGTPGAPAAKAAEEATKAAVGAAMSAAIAAAASASATPSGGMPDIHACPMPMGLVPHGPGVVIDGSKTVQINDLPASRMGDTILEALGPPNKIQMGISSVWIGDEKAPPPGAPDYPYEIVMPDGTIATVFAEGVIVTGTLAERAEKCRQLEFVRAGPGGDALFNDLASRPQPTVVNVIGNPARGAELHPGQQSYENCAVQSSQQIINEATGVNNNESQMENIANNPNNSGYTRTGGTPAGGEATILTNGGVPAHTEPGTTANVDQALANNQGVVSGHDAGALWNDPNYNGSGHAVNTTGAVQDANGNTLAYTINDTGTDERGRVVPASDYANSMDGGPIAVTDNPIR